MCLLPLKLRHSFVQHALVKAGQVEHGLVVQEQQEKNLVLKARLAQLNETLSSGRSRDSLMRSPKQLLETC